MNATVWNPPTSGVPAKDMALWNAAMSHMEAELPLDNNGVLRLSPVSAPRLLDTCHEITLKTGGVAYFHIDAFPFKALLNVDFESADLGRLEGPLHDAICEGVLQSVLNAVPQDIRGNFSVANLVSIEAMQRMVDGGELVWFAAVLAGLCPEPMFFTIGLTPENLCAFLNTQVVAPRTVLTGLKAKIERRVLRFVGRANLPSAQVGNLETGDLVVLEHADLEGIALQDGQNIYLFENSEAGWICTNIHPVFSQDGNHHMDDPTILAADAEGNEAPEITLQVADIAQTLLTFDLGEVSVSLAQLEQFQVGAIVSLPEASQSEANVEVTVRIAGNKIATGDLVQIDDRIAVRLNSILFST